MKERLLVIHVICHEAISVQGSTRTIVMIPFEGTAEGPLFSGRVTGPGVDTQTVTEGTAWLSARYMLEGKDAAGNACRIFIENQGSSREGFCPAVVTDSPLLRDWETTKLSATVEPGAESVTVTIFREKTGAE